MIDYIAERLDKAIAEQAAKFKNTAELFGVGDWKTSREASELRGMERAFEIVTGRRYIGWWLEHIEQKEG